MGCAGVIDSSTHRTLTLALERVNEIINDDVSFINLFGHLLETVIPEKAKYTIHRRLLVNLPEVFVVKPEDWNKVNTSVQVSDEDEVAGWTIKNENGTLPADTRRRRLCLNAKMFRYDMEKDDLPIAAAYVTVVILHELVPYMLGLVGKPSPTDEQRGETEGGKWWERVVFGGLIVTGSYSEDMWKVDMIAIKDGEKELMLDHDDILQIMTTKPFTFDRDGNREVVAKDVILYKRRIAEAYTDSPTQSPKRTVTLRSPPMKHFKHQ
ncbi:hypothetical protein HK104_010455 [Borealophlyctis nickersoniae]|nr:hypothetical protein HK104_010455 [Borealophlyctis nickersoniae]